MNPRLAMWLGQIRPRRVVVDGLVLTVPPRVLDPVLFRAGAWLARQVAARARGRLLDLGCGTGVVGLLARRAGADVVGSDVDPRAVAAARANGLPDVRLGDLFTPVLGERFDIVTFNPPWIRRAAGRHPLGRALFGGTDLEVIRRFVAEVPAHLAPGGESLVVLSRTAPQAFEALGPGWERITSEVVEGEEFVLLGSRP